MASLTRKSVNGVWIACYTDLAGKQRQKSTGTDDKETAQRMAEQLEAPHQKKKLVRRCQELGITHVDPDVSAQLLPGSGSLTGFPDDWIIREHLTKKRMRGGSDPDLLRAVERLVTFEDPRHPGSVRAVAKAGWTDAWSRLGETVLASLTESADPNFFRKLDDAAKKARESNDADKKLTRAEQIYWFAACFFKKHGRPVSRYELEVNLAQLDVPVGTVKKTLAEWQIVLAGRNIHWTIDQGDRRTTLIVSEFENESDLWRGRNIYPSLTGS